MQANPSRAIRLPSFRAEAIVGLIALALSIFGLATATRSPDDDPAPAVHLVIDPNSAPIGVLSALPGLGPVRLQAIEEARKARPFASLEDLDRRVRGVGPATAREIAPYLRFDSPSSNP